jgi:hypothetical protein
VHFTNDGREYNFKCTDLAVLREDLVEITKAIDKEIGKERLQ